MSEEPESSPQQSEAASSPQVSAQFPAQPAQQFFPSSAPDPNHIPAMALSGNNAQRTLWIGDVPSPWSEEKLGEVFTECSHPPYKVKRVFIKGELQHYCFVEFTSFEEARNTLYDLNGNRVPGTKGKNRFNLCFANDSYNPNSEFNLHVSNLPTDLSDAELYRVFDKYPSCRGAKMFRFSDGSSKGCGFVRFGDQTDQQMALLEMHRTRVQNMSIQIRLAGSKGERLDREKGGGPGGFRKERFGGDRGYIKGRQNMVSSYRTNQAPTNEKPINYYGADNPWAIMPEENDIDPVIGLDLLPAKYRPHTTNKRFMLDSEQFMLDLDSSRWTPVVMRINEKAEDLDKKLEASKWAVEMTL